jgi:hypothetical protein
MVMRRYRIFGRFMELSDGTFRIVVDDVLAKGDRVIVLVTESAAERPRLVFTPSACVTVRDGQAKGLRQFQGISRPRTVLVVSPDRDDSDDPIAAAGHDSRVGSVSSATSRRCRRTRRHHVPRRAIGLPVALINHVTYGCAIPRIRRPIA